MKNLLCEELVLNKRGILFNTFNSIKSKLNAQFIDLFFNNTLDKRLVILQTTLAIYF